MNENHGMPKHGRILFGQAPAVDCTIQKLSPLGATLQFEDRAEIPNTFTLQVASVGSSYPSRVLWRDTGTIEVLFTQPLLCGLMRGMIIFRQCG